MIARLRGKLISARRCVSQGEFGAMALKLEIGLTDA